ncbi:hypothetical protein JHFBIEKO_1049 [Methylobacterium mesophilicum]|nr:hypothetical protein JHFBIEKO_1049 [Methylobacterium mesophilicum]
MPSSVVMRTPLTVTRSTIFEPAIGSPASFMARKRAVTVSTTPYFTSSAQWDDMVGEPQVFGNAR